MQKKKMSSLFSWCGLLRVNTLSIFALFTEIQELVIVHKKTPLNVINTLQNNSTPKEMTDEE